MYLCVENKQAPEPRWVAWLEEEDYDHPFIQSGEIVAGSMVILGILFFFFFFKTEVPWVFGQNQSRDPLPPSLSLCLPPSTQIK